MRVTFIGHASLLIEANGISVLSDPWWNGPCFGAQWWLYPRPFVEPLAGRSIDYVYVSHGHHDHFHPATLKTLPRTVKVLVSGGSGLAAPVRHLGFEVIEVTGEHDLGNGVRCRIVDTLGGDTLMGLSDGRQACLNLNDALHATPAGVRQRFYRLIHQLYPRIDYVFCGYGTASHFPNCYVIPGKDREATAARRQRYFNTVWAEIIGNLRPTFGFPFAADVVFLEDELFWSNEPIHNSERPIESFQRTYGRGAPSRVMDIAPGFAIEDGDVVTERLRKAVSSVELRRSYADEIRRVNRVAPVDCVTIRELAALLQTNIARQPAYLQQYEGDYRCLLHLAGADDGIEVIKRNSSLEVAVVPLGVTPEAAYDVVFKSRSSYVRGSLTTAYGHETLFVGSGGRFVYPDAERITANVHAELMAMLRPPQEGGRRRMRAPGGPIPALKQLVKRVLGRVEEDLYDLRRWTAWQESRALS
jgi:L-ascorbate metabolism protein UlaG (beta-lactamase superfamily)